MRETGPPGPRPDDPLAAIALLYACGELEGAEAADFERRLGSDQSARDALCQAVEFNRELNGLAALAPDPAYRERVRRRLLPTRRVPAGLAAVLRSLAWSFAGAAAAVLMMLTLPRGTARSVPDAGAAAPLASPERLPLPADDGAPAADTALVWAELHNGDHLARVRNQEVRRRLPRHDDRHTARADQRLSRLLPPVRMHN